MFQRIFIFILLVAFAMQSFQKNLIVLDYVANIAVYIEQCINKDKPELKCKGKCQMMIKLQAEAEKEQQSPEHKGENKGPILFPLPQSPAVTAMVQAYLKTSYKPFDVERTVDRPASIFQPPSFS